MADPGFGIYIHWPFCQSKCPYCDFNSHVWSEIDHEAWCDAYLCEIDRLAEETSELLVRSVYFGGGTPSLMSGRTVDRLLDRIRARWRFENLVEITLEANPGSVETDRFVAYREAGVTRISIGVQALNDKDLRRLGRLHSTEDALRALDVARNTFERVNFDLIYARQDQSLNAWMAELDQALRFDPSHLSLYQLTIEPGTAFGERFDLGKLGGLPDEDLGADLWDATQEMTNKVGLPGYEVSNHAKPGQESLHNLIYWNCGDYLGLGPGAHGRLSSGPTRWATEAERSPSLWLRSVQARSSSHEHRTRLSRQEVDQELLMMGLRLRSGVDIPDELDKTLYNSINYLVDIGMVQKDARTLSLTEQGRPLLNAVLRHLLKA